jgi:hypothetical protein
MKNHAILQAVFLYVCFNFPQTRFMSRRSRTGNVQIYMVMACLPEEVKRFDRVYLTLKGYKGAADQ